MAVWAILGVPKMALRVPESKFWDHFIYLIPPQNPQKDTLGSGIGPWKVIFGHFTFYIDILAPFLECKQLCKPRMPNFAVDLWSDLDSENCSEISAVTSLGICLLFFPFPTFVFFTPPYCPYIHTTLYFIVDWEEILDPESGYHLCSLSKCNDTTRRGYS